MGDAEVPSLFGLFAPDAIIDNIFVIRIPSSQKKAQFGLSMLDRPAAPIWGPILIMNIVATITIFK